MYILFVFCSIALAQTGVLLQPLTLARLLTLLQEGKPTFQGIAVCMGLYLLCDTIVWVCHYPIRIVDAKNGYIIRANLRRDIFRALTDLPLMWHKDALSGENIEKLNRAANALHDFAAYLYLPVGSVIRLLGAFIALFLLSFTIGCAVFTISCLAFIFISITDKFYIRLRLRVNHAENVVTGRLFDFLSNITTVITLRLQGQTRGELSRTLNAAVPYVVQAQTVNELKWWGVNAFLGTMIVSLMLFKAYSDLGTGVALTVGSYYLLFEYLRRVGGCYVDFALKWGDFVRQWTDVKGVEGIRDEATRYRSLHTHPVFPGEWHTLTIEALSFAYENGNNRIENLSFSLSRGKRYALIGESGSGKSTLLRLLRGILEAQNGRVIVDGTRILPLASIADETTLIPQDPEIFAATIRANVSCWVTTDDGAILHAIELARFGSILERMDKGLDTNIAEKGVNLSGGEKQRLALARGIFFATENQILLLDEPTSSVDAYNERRIYENIFSEFRDKTIISSLHKFHLLDLFDEVLFFENGSVVAQGHVNALLSREPRFASLYNQGIIITQRMD